VFIAGCAAQEGASPVVRPTSDASATRDATGAVEDIALPEAVEASYQLWQANGMTEQVTSAGDRYLLTYRPNADDAFFAGLYNLDLDDTMPIEQPELFTVYSAWAMLKDDETVVVEGTDQLSRVNKACGDFTVFIENGLVVSGEEGTGAWTGVFSYDPDLPLLGGLNSR
jgi:hypothetical protein